MAKKSPAGRHRPTTAHGKGPAHKQQAPERVSTATLVRADGQPGPSAANVVADPTPAPVAKPTPAPAVKRERPVAPAAKPTPVSVPTAKAPAAEKPATPAPVAAAAAAKPAASATTTTATTATAAKPAAKPAAPRPALSTREQNTRLARVRATQRARTDHLISAENYTYVVGDLKLVVGLAVTAFAVLIALAFILPH